MLGQVVGAQFDLERSIAELPVGARAESEQQLRALKQLQRQIGQASPTALGSIRAEISAAIAEARAVLQQGVNAARAAAAAEIETLAAASASARATAQSFVQDFYGRKVFDDYLRFSSAEDEAEYRKREAANHKAIEAALTKETPEGNLEATRLAKAQLVDAGAHGADRSPEYGTWMRALDQQEKTLGQALPDGSGKTIGSGVRPPLSASVPSDTDVDNALAILRTVNPVPLASSPQAGHGLSRNVAALGDQRGRVT